jgi:RNA polymerase sigma-70 factor, ECF subfamily
MLDGCLGGKPGPHWRTFVSTFNKLIQITVIRTAQRCGRCSPELVDDLVQDVYLRICANDYKVLREFRSPEPKALYGLIQAVATTVTLDHFRTWSAEKRGAGEEPIPLDVGLPLADKEAPAEVEQSVLFQEIDQHLGKICPTETAARDRRIFWLYFRHGFSAKDISALPGVALTDKGVESTLHRMTQSLRSVLGAKGRGA